MPQIKSYEAGPGDLKPSEIGSATNVRAGTVAREYTDQTARLMRESGSILDRSFHEIGSAVTTAVDHAQATTDAQATLEANKDASALDLSFSNKIDEMGKPTKDPQTGETKQPSLADATQFSAQQTELYKDAQDHIREKMVAAGASKRALANHDERALERQTMIQHKMIAETHAIAGAEAAQNIEKFTNTAAEMASSNPGDLPAI